MNNATKDVEIGGARYQVGRIKARPCSFLLATVMTKILPAVVGSALKKDAGAALEAARALLSEEEFIVIQGHALSVCRRYENGLPMPIFLLPDTWAVKELEYDVVTVMALTIESLVFNLSPFFEGDGLSKILGLLPQAGPNSSPSST